MFSTPPPPGPLGLKFSLLNWFSKSLAVSIDYNLSNQATLYDCEEKGLEPAPFKKEVEHASDWVLGQVVINRNKHTGGGIFFNKYILLSATTIFF